MMAEKGVVAAADEGAMLEVSDDTEAPSRLHFQSFAASRYIR
jgi:hypothetical protein